MCQIWRRNTCRALAVLAALLRQLSTCLAYHVPAPPDMSADDLLCILSSLANFSVVHWYTRSLLQSELAAAPHRTCAVVSNSGILRRLQHGAAIDEADMVIRFNDAPVQGYAKNVGTKDDLRLMNHLFAGEVLHPTEESHFQLPLSTNTTYLTFPETEADVELVRRLMETHPKLRIFAADLGLQARITTLIQGIYPSEWFGLGNDGEHWVATTGAAGMVIAMALCEEVKAYGMASSELEHNFPYHYYDPGRTHEIGVQE